MINISEIVSRFVYELCFENIDLNLISKFKLFIADYYSASIAGYKVNSIFNRAIEAIINEEGGKEESTILLSPHKRTAVQAAYLNSLYAHGADIDDGNKKSAGHIGAQVFSAIFALAETIKCEWKDVILASVVGYDVFNRIAGAAQPSLYRKGFHSTGVAGALACAAACAKLLKLTKEQIYNSISIAAIQSSGLIIIDESGQSCKPINPANAARIGILSAKMAQKGIEGPKHPLESKKGWFNAFSDVVDEAVIFSDLGKHFTINDCYIKLYPTCRHTHCCIDAIIDIREQLIHKGFSIANIDDIQLYIYLSAIKSAGNIKYPTNSSEAKFSIYYAMAKSLIEGSFSIDDLDIIYSKEVNHIIDIITINLDETMENREKGIRGCRVIVNCSNNRFSKTVLVPKGEGDSFLTWDDLTNKMLQCSKDIIKTEEAIGVIEKCKHINPENQFEPIKI